MVPLSNILDPPQQCVRESLRPVRRNAATHQQDSRVWLECLMELPGPVDVVVAVPSNEYSAIRGGQCELLVVVQTTPADFVDAFHIETKPPRRLCYTRAQVFV